MHSKSHTRALKSLTLPVVKCVARGHEETPTLDSDNAAFLSVFRGTFEWRLEPLSEIHI